jgi:hypothetical protein
MLSFPCVRVRLYLCIHISVHAPFLALFFFVIVFDLYAIFFNSAVSVSEVEALFELYKSISSSVVDDGLISKVSLMVFFYKKKHTRFFLICRYSFFFFGFKFFSSAMMVHFCASSFRVSLCGSLCLCYP